MCFPLEGGVNGVPWGVSCSSLRPTRLQQSPAARLEDPAPGAPAPRLFPFVLSTDLGGGTAVWSRWRLKSQG